MHEIRYKEFTHKYGLDSFGSITLDANLLRTRCYNNLIKLQYEHQEYQETINTILIMKSRNLNNLQTFRILGECYFSIQEYKEAANAYLEYLESNNVYYVSYKLALAYFFLEDYQKAVSTFNFIIDENEDKINKQIFFEIELSSSNYEKNTFLEMKNFFHSVLFYRARSYGKMHKYQKGIVDLDQALILVPESETSHYYRGYFHNYLGESDKALVDFLKVIQLNPDRNSVRLSVALIYDSIGDFNNAILYYKEYLANSTNENDENYQIAIKRMQKLKQKK